MPKGVGVQVPLGVLQFIHVRFFEASNMFESRPDPVGYFRKSPEEKLNNMVNFIREARNNSGNSELNKVLEKALEIMVQ